MPTRPQLHAQSLQQVAVKTIPHRQTDPKPDRPCGHLRLDPQVRRQASGSLGRRHRGRRDSQFFRLDTREMGHPNDPSFATRVLHGPPTNSSAPRKADIRSLSTPQNLSNGKFGRLPTDTLANSSVSSELQNSEISVCCNGIAKSRAISAKASAALYQQRGSDRTLRDRNDCVRATPAIARITSCIKGKTNSIPIAPWFTCEHVDRLRPFHVAAFHGLEQDGLLQSKLRLVIRMLIVATAASSEVATAGYYSLRGGVSRLFPLLRSHTLACPR